MTKSVYSQDYIIFREMLTKERLDAGLSQATIAAKLNVNQTFVSKYELGERRIDIIEFFEIAEAIGFDALKFLKKLHSQL